MRAIGARIRVWCEKVMEGHGRPWKVVEMDGEMTHPQRQGDEGACGLRKAGS